MKNRKEASGEPEKNPFIRYIKLLWEKRWKLIQVNLLYVAFNLLLLAAVIGLLYVISSLALSLTGQEAATYLNDKLNLDTFLRIVLFTAFFTTSLPIFSIGPVQAGFTFVLKSYVVREPIFLWTDFSTKIRSNKKLGLIAGLINGLLGGLLILDAVVYVIIANDTTGLFRNVPPFVLFLAALVIIFGFVVLSMMSLYIYPMMVTFKITVKQLYKNAFIFAMIKWLPNLGILLADLVIVGVPILLLPGRLSFWFGILAYVLIIPALVGVTNNYFVYPAIKKYMIDNPAADRSEAAKARQAAAREELEKKKKEEFVPPPGMLRYVNGRYLSDEEFEEYLKHAEIPDSYGKEGEETDE